MWMEADPDHQAWRGETVWLEAPWRRWYGHQRAVARFILAEDIARRLGWKRTPHGLHDDTERFVDALAEKIAAWWPERAPGDRREQAEVLVDLASRAPHVDEHVVMRDVVPGFPEGLETGQARAHLVRSVASLIASCEGRRRSKQSRAA
jgi:hypothetical protein